MDRQTDFSKSITKLNKKPKLFLLCETPQTLLLKLFKVWRISHLVFEKDTDFYARERDDELMKLVKKARVEVMGISRRTLYDSDEFVKGNGGEPTMSISQVQNASLTDSFEYFPQLIH